MEKTKTIVVNGVTFVDHGTLDLNTDEIYLKDGSRLTDERAEELVEEFRAAAIVGRPSLTAPGTRSPQLRIAIPQALSQGLNERAAQEHRTVSDLAREALQVFLAS